MNTAIQKASNIKSAKHMVFSYGSWLKQQKKSILVTAIFFSNILLASIQPIVAPVFADPEVRRKIERDYVPVMIDVDSKEEIWFNGEAYSVLDFARSMNVSAVPTLLFISSGGEVMAHQTGFVSADRMSALLDFVVSDKFGTISFDEYLKETS